MDSIHINLLSTKMSLLYHPQEKMPLHIFQAYQCFTKKWFADVTFADATGLLRKT